MSTDEKKTGKKEKNSKDQENSVTWYKHGQPNKKRQF